MGSVIGAGVGSVIGAGVDGTEASGVGAGASVVSTCRIVHAAKGGGGGVGVGHPVTQRAECRALHRRREARGFKLLLIVRLGLMPWLVHGWA